MQWALAVSCCCRRDATYSQQINEVDDHGKYERAILCIETLV